MDVTPNLDLRIILERECGSQGVTIEDVLSIGASKDFITRPIKVVRNAAILKMRSMGASTFEIGEAVGCSPSTVSAILKSNGAYTFGHRPASQACPKLVAIAQAFSDQRERTVDDVRRDARLDDSPEMTARYLKTLQLMGLLERHEPVTNFATWKPKAVEVPREAST
tara:strand:- start:685 stop:1185 length:501 start_codon:yes stop_codon:yes gene_type:complete